MKDDKGLQKNHKKIRFFTFFFIPFLFFISLILGSWIAKNLGFKIEIKGVLFVIFVLIMVYFLTIRSFLKKVQARDADNLIVLDD